MDPIDELDSKKRRGLETTQRVSEYMRSTAKRVAQKTVTEAKADETPAPEQDQLDFSSEFTNQDMGLNSRGGFTPVLNWDKPVEDESDDDEAENDEQEQEQGSPPDEQDQDDATAPPTEESAAPPPNPPASDQTSSPVEEAAAPMSAPAAEKVALAPETASSKGLPAKTDHAPKRELSWDDPENGRTETPTATPPPSAPLAAGSVSVSGLERIRPVSRQAVPSAGQHAAIDPAIVSTAALLIATPESEPGYQECVRLLSRFGLGALRMCVRNKVSVEILDDDGFASHPELRAWNLTPQETPSDGAYLVASRAVLVDRRCLLSKPHFFHPALYYFAHAFDHAQGGENFSSRKAAAVVACYEASTRAAGGFDFMDELAAADPVRYFARSVAVYLGRDDCLSPLMTHQDMYDFDRAMYDYLQYLFARFTT